MNPRALTLALLIFSLLIPGLSVDHVSAESWGFVTIQYSESSSYGNTYSLLPATVEYAKANLEPPSEVYFADDKDNQRVSSVLQKLEDGDVLVLNCHAYTGGFGVGKKSAKWEDFYTHWEVSEPPKLSLVILNGCIYSVSDDGGVTPATDTQIQDIRRSLNARALITYNNKVSAQVGALNVHNFVKNILAGKKIADLISGQIVRFVVEPGIDAEKATLGDVRNAAPKELPPSLAANLDEYLQGEMSMHPDYRRSMLQGMEAYFAGKWSEADKKRWDENLTRLIDGYDPSLRDHVAHRLRKCLREAERK